MIFDHDGDLPDDVTHQLLFEQSAIAVDSETTGLDPRRDRLCLVQVGTSAGNVHLVALPARRTREARNLRSVLASPNLTKICHYARFEMSFFQTHLAVMMQPVFCTKIASKIARTYTQYHGLANLCEDLLGVKLEKQTGQSDWGSLLLTPKQQIYAANDVVHLHALRIRLEVILHRENRFELYEQAVAALPAVVNLSLGGFDPEEVFKH